MKNIPFEEAKSICEKYKKEQCIILSWDSTTGETWVTTFGVGDANSIMACNGGIALKDFLKLKRENDEIPKRFEEWKIESVDRYWYYSSRYGKTYIETTFWFEAHTSQRKETQRKEYNFFGEKWQLPEWAKSIIEHKRTLDYDY